MNLKPNFISLKDKHGCEYPFVCIPIEFLCEINFSEVQLDYTFALVEIINKEITDKKLIGKVTQLTQLNQKIKKEINELKPTHLLLYHAFADFYIIKNDRLSDFGFKKIWY